MRNHILFVSCRLLLFFVTITAIATISAKPDRPDAEPKKKDEPPKIPSVAGETNWGKIEQFGSAIRISGNASWEAATGEVFIDGRVVVRWVCLSDGRRPAFGVYKLVGVDLVGHWGWETDCRIDDAGELTGSRSTETLWRQK